MPTGDSRTNFADKRNLPVENVKDHFFDFLADQIFEIASRVWGSRRGVFGSAVLAADGADQFKINALPKELLDGNGNILILDAGAAEGIQFENALGVTYYVAARHCLVPSEVLHNPRLPSVKFYDVWVDTVGVSGIPDSVTDLGATLRVVVDSVFEAGVSHAGRLVTIWLNAPKTTDEAVAIERDLVVAWDGSNNYVTTSAHLGQGTVSAVAADYTVAATGLTVRRGTDLSTVSPYAYLGTVEGAGSGVAPSVFSTVGQIDVTSGLNPTLDLAYDGGPAGAGGSGRVVTVDSGAVELNAGAATGDPRNAILVLGRYGTTGSSPQIGALCELGDDSSIPILSLYPLTAGANLLEMENVTLTGAGNRITFTRGAIDLTAAYIDRSIHLVYVSGSASDDAFYVIDAFTSSTIDVLNLDGTTPSFSAGAASARVLCPRFSVGCSGVTALAGGAGLKLNGTLHLGRDDSGGETPLRIHPNGATSLILEVLSNRVWSGGSNELDPRAGIDVSADPHGTGSPGLTLNVGKLYGTVGGEAGVHVPVGLNFQTRCNGVGRADDYGLNVGPMTNGDLVYKHSSRVACLKAYGDLEYLRVTPFGRIARGALYEDDFLWRDIPAHRYELINVGGAGSAYWNTLGRLLGKHGGFVELETGGSAGDTEILVTPQLFIARHGAETEQLRAYLFSTRFCLPPPSAGTSTLDVEVEIGLDFGVLLSTKAGVRYHAGGVASSWEAFAEDAATVNASAALLLGAQAPATTDENWITFEAIVDVDAGIMSYGLNGSYVAAINLPNAASVNWDNKFRLFASVKQTGAQSKNVALDHWYCQELKIKGAFTEYPKE